MKISPKLHFAALVLFLAMLACNLPSATPPSTAPDIQTAAALTVRAVLTTSATSTVHPSIIGVSQTPDSAVTATITPTYSTPMLTVLQQTNCRTGPGQDYEIVFTYLPKAKLVILGRYEIENY